ncbi:hypothetical protein [Haloarcula sp. CBA1122]|uniref:hypothetical protein n=1 Tax=Haloarcula sp. CBA1122 TaxID=2668069 RepID=UPI0020903DFB|nr:hypothetical protein [Haloarcula sp. CBA1122]
MTGVPANATVLNTTVLSNFAQVDHIELIADLLRLVTVPAVQMELTEGVETHRYLERAVTALEEEIPVIEASAEAHQIEQSLLEMLDPGEAQALAVADDTDGTIVTDDGMHVRLRINGASN